MYTALYPGGAAQPVDGNVTTFVLAAQPAYECVAGPHAVAYSLAGEAGVYALSGQSATLTAVIAPVSFAVVDTHDGAGRPLGQGGKKKRDKVKATQQDLPKVVAPAPQASRAMADLIRSWPAANLDEEDDEHAILLLLS
jgi:hypothetical protein